MRPSDVCARYDFSIIVQRWAANWIDILFRAFIIAVACLVSTEGSLPLAIGLSVIFYVLYYPLLEGFIGQTPGKYVCCLKVVDIDGNTPGITRAIVRSLFRLLEINFFLFGGIPAAIAAHSSKTRQRLGDRVAGTYVIRTKDMAWLSYGSGIGTDQSRTQFSPVIATPAALRPRDADPTEGYDFTPASTPQPLDFNHDLPGIYPQEPSAIQFDNQRETQVQPPDPLHATYGLPAASPDLRPEARAWESPAEEAAPPSNPYTKQSARPSAYFAWSVLLMLPAIAMIAGGRGSQLASHGNLQPTTISCANLLRDHSLVGWYHVTGCEVNIAKSQGMYYYLKSNSDSGTPHIDSNTPPYKLFVPVFLPDEEKAASLVVKSTRQSDLSLFQEIDKVETSNDKKAMDQYVKANLARIIFTRDFTGMISEGDAHDLDTDNAVKAFDTKADFRMLDLDAAPMRGAGPEAGYGFGFVFLGTAVILAVIGVRRRQGQM